MVHKMPHNKWLEKGYAGRHSQMPQDCPLNAALNVQYKCPIYRNHELGRKFHNIGKGAKGLAIIHQIEAQKSACMC